MTIVESLVWLLHERLQTVDCLESAQETMPWSSRATYGSLENGEDHECQKSPSDELSTIIAIFTAFFVWLILVAFFSMILVILLDEKDVIP